MKATKLLWKSMKPGLNSAHGEINWKLGEWQKCDKQLSLCAHGFHASENVVDAMGFVRAAIIARVEVRGDHIGESDKQCWSEMRIVEAKEWTKEDSVALAILAARLVLPIWEKKHPTDKRVRNAIETVERYASGDDGVSREILLEARRQAAAADAAAYAADAADAAAYVAYAAYAAAYAADAAADAAAAAAAAAAAYAAYAYADAAAAAYAAAADAAAAAYADADAAYAAYADADAYAAYADAAAAAADAAAYAAAARAKIKAQCADFVLARIKAKPAMTF